MAREELAVHLPEEVELYKHFGWTFFEDRYGTRHARVGRRNVMKTTHAYILARDTDMPNYRLLKAYQDKYIYLKSQKKYYSGIDIEWAICLFLLLIIPGIIYVTCKSNKKHRIEKYNDKIQKEMDAVVSDADALL